MEFNSHVNSVRCLHNVCIYLYAVYICILYNVYIYIYIRLFKEMTRTLVGPGGISVPIGKPERLLYRYISCQPKPYYKHP